MTLTEKILTILTIILFFVMFGFFSDIRNSSCSIPDISIMNVKQCPNICECDKSLPECSIPECNYLHCRVQWYGICLIWGI